MKTNRASLAAAFLLAASLALAQPAAAPTDSTQGAPATPGMPAQNIGPNIVQRAAGFRGAPARGPRGMDGTSQPPPEDLGPPLPDNITLSLKGSFAADYPVDFAVTGAGPKFTKSGKVDAQDSDKIAMNFTAVVQVAAGAYQVDFTFRMSVPVVVAATSTTAANPSAAKTISYRNIAISSSVMLKSGQSVEVLDDNGKTLILTLAKTDGQ